MTILIIRGGMTRRTFRQDLGARPNGRLPRMQREIFLGHRSPPRRRPFGTGRTLQLNRRARRLQVINKSTSTIGVG